MENIFSFILSILSWFGEYGIPFIVVLGVLVFVHEWGHYYVARLCGVKVTQFSIGFGKEIWGFEDKNGTRWKVSLIPLGGYVQMFGDTDPASAGTSDKVNEASDDGARTMTEEERKVAFFSQPLWQRAAIVFAGPAINFIFAIILLFGLYVSLGKPVTSPTASAIVVGGAAYEAGIKPHDEIIEINGQKILSFEAIQRAVLVDLNTGMDITVLRDGQEVVFENVEPELIKEEDRFGFQQSRGQLGIIGPGFQLDKNAISKIKGEEVAASTDKNSLLASLLGQEFEVSINQGDKEALNLLVAPKIDDNKTPQDFEGAENFIMLASTSKNAQIVDLSVSESFFESINETKVIVSSTMEALWQIISGVRSAQELGGIIRIGAIAGDAAQAGLIALITFTALLSINLGLINLFPIPMLDGGHLLFYAVEAIKGSPIPEQTQEYAFRFGLAILVALMLFTNLNDIVQLVL